MKKIIAETYGQKFDLYVWEQQRLEEKEFKFIGAYALYGYHNDLLYAGITETRDVGVRIKEHLKATGAQASPHICKQLDHTTGKFIGRNTGYEEFIYRIEVYQFKNEQSRIWFETFLIMENNPPCNFAERTDLVATDPLKRLKEWDINRENYFNKTPKRESWSALEQEAAKQQKRIEELVLKNVAKRMGIEYPYFHSKDMKSLPDKLTFLTESEFVQELILKLNSSKGEKYTERKIYELARKIGISHNKIETKRLNIDPVPLNVLIP